MDKKKKPESDDLKGFEDFIHQLDDAPADKGQRNSAGESLTFLQNDNERLRKVATLMSETLPVAHRHTQAEKILQQQRHHSAVLKHELFNWFDPAQSTLQRTLSDLWDGFFSEKKR